ncbi:MAG: ribbon-helix-helix protein, CopG family [Nostocaceae cyanobacterium]|nr:ribbon-helix-helix protein, CopG family [Nostocaceae cyanobacterium]
MTITAKKKVHPIRFTDKEYEWLKEKAEEEGVSVGEIVRELVKEGMRRQEFKSPYAEN